VSPSPRTLADPYNQLPAITFWLLGSFASVVPGDLALALPLIVLGSIPLVALRWRVNLLALPEDEAAALGIDVPRLRLIVIAAATLVTSAGVAIAGVIGWVGLVVPHVARLLVGPGFARGAPGVGDPRQRISSRGRHDLPDRGRGRASAGCGDGAHRDAHLHRASRGFFAQGAMSIAARGLAFGYPRRVVGRDLDLALEAGEVLCVLGPNGAGKTTLFRTLLGLLPALEGRVLIDGEDLAAMPREAVARAVAYVPQSSAMAFDFTLEEIVVMGRSAHLGPFAAPGRRDLEIAHAALDRLGIAALADRPFGEVSGGERQLALIARALATEARAIVMDDPPRISISATRHECSERSRGSARRGESRSSSAATIPITRSRSPTACSCSRTGACWPRARRPRCSRCRISHSSTASRPRLS
jgi:ABC-type branched-subunit amino acid transport system ATPase component